MGDWFLYNWQWIGAVAAVILLVLMFATKLLQADKNISRWKDITWLSWAITVAFMLHNIEEYGIDLLGQTYAFPQGMETILQTVMGFGAPPAIFFVLVNTPIIWVAGPVAAALSRRHPLIGLSLYGIMLINSLIHIIPGFLMGYNAGLFTAVVLYLPLLVVVGRTYFGKNKMGVGAFLWVTFTGIQIHLLLVGSIILYSNGIISLTVACIIQILNPGITILLLMLGEKWKGGKVVQPDSR